MAKVFISVLGTNNYVPCSYMYRDQIVIKETRFVQEATVSLCCRDWSDKDRILIFTTDEAEKKNWLDDGHCDEKTKKPIKQQGLKTILEALKLKPKVTNVKIPEGESEKQIWEIFQAIFDNLHQGDEIVFDITHAFRSIPMLVMVVLSYAKVIKSVKLEGIYYGAFEVLGNPRDVCKKPLEERNAPIFDLTEFDRLLDWTMAIDRFVSSGDASLAADLAKKAAIPRLAISAGADLTARSIRNTATKMDAFARNLSTCRGRDISGSASKLKDEIAAGKTPAEKLLPPLVPLLGLVYEKISPFVGDKVKDGVSAARWCMQHNLIQQGFTILQETLISYLIQQVGDDIMLPDNRRIAASSIGIWRKRTPESEWTGDAGKYSEKTKQYLALFESQNQWVSLFTGGVYDKLTDYRNDLNHGGFTGNTHDALEFKKVLSEIIIEIEKFI